MSQGPPAPDPPPPTGPPHAPYSPRGIVVLPPHVAPPRPIPTRVATRIRLDWYPRTVRRYASPTMLTLMLATALTLGDLPADWTIRTGRITERVTVSGTQSDGTRRGFTPEGDPVTMRQEPDGTLWMVEEDPDVCRVYIVAAVRGRTLYGESYDYSPDCRTRMCVITRGGRALRCSWPFRARAR